MTVRRTVRKGGFTLVEILIVVIILGILAAIVIPQFTSASQDARKNSLTSQLQTLRSQIELYKLQHLDSLPTGLVAATTDWSQLINKTDQNGSTAASTATVFGPYLQAIPTNPMNNLTDIKPQVTDWVASAAVGDTTHGFVMNSVNGKIWGTSKSGGFVYNENPQAPEATTNDK